MDNSGSASGPPRANPVLAYYQEWAEKTPFVTRYSLIVMFTLFVLSLFLPLDMFLGNMPYFTVYKFEVYRIFLSFLVGNSFLMLIFACLFFPSMGGRMEAAYGSAYFLYLILMFAVLTNVTYTVVCVLFGLMGSDEMMFMNCSGFWVVLFSFITMECMLVSPLSAVYILRHCMCQLGNGSIV
jgi:membrane associated rhomboid family serine protease